ncbi:MAG: hypothetical protein NC314_02165 [Roseburia sp.]|nr:hypothetical protein [Roseburia sp.]MCM1241621.1 hypothetical protein [Roseburia sp.]
MKKRWKKLMALLLSATFVAASLTACGGGGAETDNETETGGGAENGDGGSAANAAVNTVGKSTDFTLLTVSAITQGYYDDYNDNPIAQWWLDQEWDANGDGTMTKLNVDFWSPPAGGEQDYVNNLVSTEEYPDVMALTYSSERAGALYNEGMILDLTDYIDAYMPNYKAYMEAHPEFLYTNKVDGEDKYLQIFQVNEDYLENPWGGLLYRRDWIVNYGTNPETGEAFTGEWQDGEWVDDVVFPSGNTDPVYISDWEWMLDIFKTAIDAQGMTDGYALQIPYQGIHTTGDILSGFNTGSFLSYDKDGKVVLSSDSEGFRAYTECMANWFAKGWIDPAFAERADDMFFMIDMPAVYSGQVGLWYGLEAQMLDGLAGDGSNPWTANAVAFAAATPINDMYGSEACQNVEPTVLYQDPLLGEAFVITDKAADKDIATLLTAIDYFYSREGAIILTFGLSDTMMAELEGTPSYDFYMSLGAENGAYKIEDGLLVRDPVILADNDVAEVLSGARMPGMLTRSGIDFGYTNTKAACMAQWAKYKNTGGLLADITGQLSVNDQKAYSAFQTEANIRIAQWIPDFITGKKDVTDDVDWNNYVDEIHALNPEAVVDAFNAIVGK